MRDDRKGGNHVTPAPPDGPNVVDYASATPARRTRMLSKVSMAMALTTWGLFGLAFPLFNELLLLSSLAIGAAGVVVAIIALLVERTRLAGVALCILFVFAELVFIFKFIR
jgi:hypothetical protein